MNIVGVKSRGRLGNQMFQFAFIYAYSKKYNKSFFIDNFKHLNYFRCHDKFKSSNFRNRLLAAYWFSRGRLGFIVHNEESINIKPNLTNCIFIGYFQSLQYFEQYLDDIRSLFTIKTKYSTRKRKTPYVAVHLRLGDYLKIKGHRLGDDLALPEAYFHNAILNHTEDTDDIVIVSDNIEIAKSYLPPDRNYRFENNSEIEDFQILLNANKVIISNSTFSWWAALLNNNATEIIAPRYWLGKNFKETYPPYIYKGLKWTIINY